MTHVSKNIVSVKHEDIVRNLRYSTPEARLSWDPDAIPTHEVLLEFIRQTVDHTHDPRIARSKCPVFGFPGPDGFIVEQSALEILNASLSAKIGRELVLGKADIVSGVVNIEASYPTYRSDGSLLNMVDPRLKEEVVFDGGLVTFDEDPVRFLFASSKFVAAWEASGFQGLYFSPAKIVP